MAEKLIFDYMYEDSICSHVEIDLKTGEVTCENFTNVKHRQAFNSGPLSIERVNLLFKERCFSEQRPDKKRLLASIGLTQFNPLDIVRKTHGIMHFDKSWIRFDGEKFTHEEAKKDLENNII